MKKKKQQNETPAEQPVVKEEPKHEVKFESVVLEGVFDFDRHGFTFWIACIASLAALVVGLINHWVEIPQAWIIAAICAGIAFLFCLIGLIGKASARRRYIIVYKSGEDIMSLDYGRGKKYFIKELPIERISSVAYLEGIVQLKLVNLEGKDVEVRIAGMINAKFFIKILKDLLRPVEERPFEKDVIYVNLALEELKKAKDLYERGMISRDDYMSKKKAYVEATTGNYLMKSHGQFRKMEE